MHKITPLDTLILPEAKQGQSSPQFVIKTRVSVAISTGMINRVRQNHITTKTEGLTHQTAALRNGFSPESNTVFELKIAPLRSVLKKMQLLKFAFRKSVPCPTSEKSHFAFDKFDPERFADTKSAPRRSAFVKLQFRHEHSKKISPVQLS